MNCEQMVVLGIDGMDFDYAAAMLPELPNIQKLANEGIFAPFKSVFPPDSIPSWITCYTGKDPSEHGILESVNYFDKTGGSQGVDTSAFQGRTFWDILSNAGQKVCIINPFMAYPVWSVNGVMINGPVFIDGSIQISNPALTAGLDIPQNLGGIVDFPSKNSIGEFVKKTFKDTTEQADFGLSLLKKQQPDFYFQTFLTMDRIQHFLWRYCDTDDPTYPGSNPHSSAIKDFYRLMDEIIGKFQEAMHKDARLIIISDHGHGMRCTHCFNINEFLRKHGYVQSMADGKLFSKQLIIEKLKNSVLDFMNAHDLEDYISKVAKLVPNAKKIKKGKHITKNEVNKAYASDFTGTNPFGGVCINRDLVDDYEKTREAVMGLLSEFSVDGVPIFKWIRRREEMFKGSLMERFPDILFCLESKYGVNWGLHTKEITINPTHKKISGGHKEYGILLSNIPADKFATLSEIKMENFFSTILSLSGLTGNDKSSGKSFVKVESC